MIRNKIRDLMQWVPFTLEGYWWIRYLCGRGLPFAKRGLLGNWLKERELYVNPGQGEGRRRVLFLSFSSYWMNLSLATAVVLSGYDCDIDFVWLPYLYYWNVTPETQYSLRCFRWSNRVSTHIKEHSHLHLQNLLRVAPVEPTQEIITEVTQQSTLDTLQAREKEKINLESDVFDLKTYKYYFSRNLSCSTRLVSLLRKRAPEVIIVPSGIRFEFGMAYRIAKMLNIPCVSFDFLDQKEAMVVSDTVPAEYTDTDAMWQADEPHILSSERQQRISKLLTDREAFTGKGYTARMKLAPKEIRENLRSFLKLKADRSLALMCMNYPWGTETLGRMKGFSSVEDWVCYTIDYFGQHPDWQLVMRLHPADLRLRIYRFLDNIIRKRIKNIAENIRIIPSDARINTYGLMELSSLGIVSSSNTGLEMAARGKPVIVTSQVHYSRRGFTIDPDTIDSYRAALDRAISNPETVKLTQRQIELALCYADVYFNSFPKPFPWHPCSFMQDIVEWPIKRVFSPEGSQRFGATFEFLAHSLL